MPTAIGHCVVTGAYGYSGRYIARRLLERGCRVTTLTNSASRTEPYGGRVPARPLEFSNPAGLEASLRGADVLINTYWVRFNCRYFTFEEAVRNSAALFDAARRAGVKRVVHVSITNPSKESPFEYFRGKARVEDALRATGLSHAVLRPAVLFGGADILVNNIAWALRRFPVFGVFGDGAYRIQPIHVEDFADLAVDLAERTDDVVVDAIGPETFTYRGLVEAVAAAIGVRKPIVSVPASVGYAAARLASWFTGDIVLTREEIGGLMAGLLYVDAPAQGRIALTAWAREHAAALGTRYASELDRRLDRVKPYGQA
ncbi:MAG: NAD-dependent epimerase/dehydratase family protein [Candidatus Hydrogenedentes bacterium]|nr:NAD-dependent epimerase/dehydratase family protein [Candidatus Hydrogenedentota bacterium]